MMLRQVMGRLGGSANKKESVKPRTSGSVRSKISCRKNYSRRSEPDWTVELNTSRWYMKKFKSRYQESRLITSNKLTVFLRWPKKQLYPFNQIIPRSTTQTL